MQVKILEADVVWEQVLWRRLVQSDVEAFQSFSIWIVFSSFKEPDAL